MTRDRFLSRSRLTHKNPRDESPQRSEFATLQEIRPGVRSEDRWCYSVRERPVRDAAESVADFSFSRNTRLNFFTFGLTYFEQ